MFEDSSERTVYVRELDERVTKELLEELFIQACQPSSCGFLNNNML